MAYFADGNIKCARIALRGGSAIVLVASGIAASVIPVSSAVAQISPSPVAAEAPTAPGELHKDPGQSAPVPEAPGFADIIVTARRVEENVQKVPIAITAFTPAKLRQLDIRDISRLQNITPGVSLCCNAYFNANLIVVRGIQQGAPSYFSDVPVTPEGYGNFFDISNVEVLKGPQGTLFGQASVAGAFVYQPRKPGDKLGGYVSAVVGDYARRTIEGAVDLPLVDDRVLLRIAGITSSRRGFIHELSSNIYYGNEDYYIIRPTLTVKLTDNLENTTMFQYQHGRTTGNSQGYFVLEDIHFKPAGSSANNSLLRLNGGTQAAYDALRDQALSWYIKNGPYQTLGNSVGCASSAGPIGGPSAVNSLAAPNYSCPGDLHVDRLLINTTTLHIGKDWTVKNIFGFHTGFDFLSPQDYDNTPLILNQTGSPLNGNIPAARYFTDELQLHGKLSVFDVTAGTFNLWRKLDPGIVYTTAANNAGAVVTTALRQLDHSQTHAVYAQTNVDLSAITPGLTATVGGRYTWDSVDQTIYNYSAATIAATGTAVPSSIQGGPGAPSGHTSFEYASYTLGLQYQLARSTMLFVTNAKSYTAGRLQQNFPGFETVKPASLNNIEAGIKSTFNAGPVPVRVNASYFHGQFSNVQVTTLTQLPSGLYQNVTRNAGKAIIEGFEAEVSVKPIRQLELGGSVGHLANRFTDYPSADATTSPPTPLDLSSSRFTRSPAWKVDLHGTFTQELPGNAGELSFSADYSRTSELVHQSAVPLTPINPAIPNTGLVCSRQRTAANGYGPLSADGGTAYVDCKPPITNLDITIGWRHVLGSENLSLALSVTNVTKNIYSTAQADFERAAGFVAFQPAPPRMWSLRASYDF